MKRTLLSLALLGTFLAPQAQAADTLRIGIEAAYPPFASKTPDGKIVGFDYDIGNALCAEMKTQCTWVEGEFDGLIPALKVRKIDAALSSITITEERRRSVDFTDRYYTTDGRLAMKKGTTLDDDFSQIKGKRIGLQRGSNHERYARDVLEPKGAQIVAYTSMNEAYLDLEAGRLDAVQGDAIAVQQGLLDTDAGKEFAFAGPALRDPTYYGEGVGIAVRKGDKALAERFNQAIKALRANGTYQQIEKKYFAFDIYGDE